MRRFFVASLLLFVSVTVSAEPIIRTGFAAVESDIQKIMNETKVPGLAIGVIKDGKLIYSHGFGYRNIEKRLPVTGDTLFAIGSTTKAFTATTVAMLADEGRLRFDQPVRELVPDFRLSDEYATAHATLDDLMSHRTGVPRHDLVWYGYDNFPRQYFWERLKYLEPSKTFRESYQYNNFMFMAAGYVVERLSGDTWENFVRKKIFAPLGMVRTNFTVSEMQSDSDYSLPYSRQEGTFVQVPMRPVIGMAPAGAINSSVNEMAKWLQFNLAKGKWDGRTLVSEQAMTHIFEPISVAAELKLPFAEFSTGTYALGWLRQSYRGKDWIWHNGGIDGFSAHVGLLPEANAAIVVFQNSSASTVTMLTASLRAMDEVLGLDPIDWYARFKGLLRAPGDSKAPVVYEPMVRPAQDYQGTFRHPAYGEVVIKATQDLISLEFHGMTVAMKHLHDGLFEMHSEDKELQSGLAEMEPIYFSTNTRGQISILHWRLEPAVAPIEFSRYE